ncbi:PREDICTED: uncharacterized protein LOC109461772 [Branchiostoma belcheri]|uniref:Uncharacterized protein LOC109461772 n=1 Tax=Branchiostoma belcheri TaxID=7741 RepID=A0A6P4XST4_BRABE|nr:PREDICTED: uncharacterized protein LOC109461772 [Branchiostoma belcheri]
MAVRSDWFHFYTRDEVMKKASLQEKLKLIRKQLDAFAVLEQEVTSRFSEDTFLNNVTRLENKYSKSQFQSLYVITNLALFRQLLLRLQLDKNQRGEDTDDKDVLEYFVDVLRLIDDIKRLNKYFSERVYTPLVENLYPAHGMEKAATSLTGHAQAVTVLSDTARNQKGEVENGKGAQTTKYDDRTAKFLRTVTRLFKLQQRWSRLSQDGPISAVLFEAETNKNSGETDDVRPLHFISRLVPDLVAKASKAVAITEKWYTLFVGMSDCAAQGEKEKQIQELREKIDKTSRNIRQLESNLAAYREELAGLTDKDARYAELTQAFQRASVSSEELSTDLSDLEETEKKITKQLEEFSQRKDIKEYEELKHEAGQIQQKLQSTR